MGFGEENQRGKVPLLSHRIKGVYYQLASVLGTVGVDLDHQAEVVFVRFPTVNLLSPPTPHRYSLEGRQPTLKGWGVTLSLP